MTLRKRLYWVLGSVAIMVVAGTGAALASGGGSSDGAAGRIDDGAELLGQASISLDEAIAAAQGAASGGLGEIDLETYEGKLVFNVDVGNLDIKVDAADGSVLGLVMDDHLDDGDDDDDKGSGP